MSAPETTSQLATEARSRALEARLFPADTRLNTYAVLDGASIPGLIGHLYAGTRPEFECLYRGELEPDMAEVAPYLVRLVPGTPFTDWLLASAWGHHWGIFACAPVKLGPLRRHLRTFSMVKDPQGKRLYFRYYDPRVLSVYLPTCNAGEISQFFGPIVAFYCEDETGSGLLGFRQNQGVLERDSTCQIEPRQP